MKTAGKRLLSCLPAGLFLSALLVSFSSCQKAPSPEELACQAALAEETARNQAVSDYLASLSDAEKISQLFLVNVEGNDVYLPVEKTGSLFGRRNEGDALVPGGCLLFSYNIASSPEKLFSYTASIRRWYRAHGRVPPYVAIDQEGGDVNRLRRITSTLVSQKKTAEWFSPEAAYALYSAQARQLRLLGIQMNLAPVVEVETASNAAFLDTRTFGSLSQVLSYGEAEVRAFEEQGIAAVLKHFPGNSNTDPHTGLPRIEIAADQQETFFKPFQALLPLSSALLISHAIVHDADSSPADGGADDRALPACFSRHWVTDMVRQQFGFQGLVFSDDIFMAALADNGYPPEKAAVAVIEAGIDCIMLSEKLFGTVAGVLLRKAADDPVFAEKIAAAEERVIRYKLAAGLLHYEPVSSSQAPAAAAAPKDSAPAYRLLPVDDFDQPGFDAAAFEDAYSAGMEFYK